MSQTNPDSHSPSIPKWFWVIGVIALLWNLLGLFAFVGEVSMSETVIAELPEEFQKLYNNMPVWVVACFCVAVVTGVAGCLLLLMRKALAVPVFAISLACIVARQIYLIFLADVPEAVMTPVAMVMALLIFSVGVVLIPYSIYCKNRGWLK